LNNNRSNNNNNNRRRGRGNNNNRQQGGQQLNRIDSRARGNAPQMLEKYRKLAHDSHLNGDRVNEEYYLQFADHYFRVIADQRVRQEEQRQPRPNDRPAEGGDEYGEDDFYADANSPYDRAGNYAPSVQGSTQGNGSQGQGSQPYGGQGQGNQAQGGQQGNYQGGNGQNGNAQNGNYQGGNTQNAGQNGEPRADRPRRNRDDRPERGERQDRGERAERQPRAAAPATEASQGELPVTATAPVESGQDGAQRNVYEPTENPFVRAERTPRAPRARKPRRQDGDEAPATTPAQDEPAASFDASMLPPAISRRDEAPAPAGTETSEEAPAKPKRRTRRAAPPADDAAGTLETVS